MPTTDLTNEYHEALGCGIGGSRTVRAGSAAVGTGHQHYRRVSRWAPNVIGIRRTCPRSRRRAARNVLDLPEAAVQHRCAASWSPTSAPTRGGTATRHAAQLRWPQAAAVSGRSTGRRATPLRSGNPDEGLTRATLIKFGVFAVVMAVLTAFLFFIFGQYRTGSTNGYSAVFTDASRLKPATRCGSPGSGWAPSTTSRCGRTRRSW